MTTQDPTPTRKPSELARLADIYRIGTDRADEAADTLQDAFAEDPFINWMLEGCADIQEQWHAKHRQYWLWCCQNLLPSWELHALGDFSAVALWYPLPEDPPPNQENTAAAAANTAAANRHRSLRADEPAGHGRHLPA